MPRPTADPPNGRCTNTHAMSCAPQSDDTQHRAVPHHSPLPELTHHTSSTMALTWTRTLGLHVPPRILPTRSHMRCVADDGASLEARGHAALNVVEDHATISLVGKRAGMAATLGCGPYVHLGVRPSITRH